MQELLGKISLRELRLIIMGLGAIVTVGLIASIVAPQAKAVRAAGKTIETLRAASVDGQELERHLQSEHEQIEQLRFRLYGDMANLPVKQVEAYIIGRLQEISWGTNVDLVSVEPAAGEQVQIFQELLFNVQAVGQYKDLYSWLWEVRNELGYVVVNEYNLTRKDDEDEEPLLVADLSLASYRAIE
jgi:Tfp pilus assembly protein PilO